MEKKTYDIKSFYPPMIVNLPDKSFIIPVWVEVPKGTTLNQIKWEKQLNNK